MFEEAANISQGEIKAYRKFAFTSALAESTHDPFFSVENATQWITSLGYQLYLEHDDSEVSQSSWTPDEASMAQLKHFRYYMVSDEFLGHPFFSLESTDRWINLVAFEAYMAANHGSFEQYRSKNSSPFSSRAPSRAAPSISLAGSRSSSHVSSVPSSRASSPGSGMLSRPSSAMSVNSVITDPLNEDLIDNSPAPGIFPEVETVPTRPESIPTAPSGLSPKQITSSKSKRKRKGKVSQQIQITRQLSVDEVVKITVVPRTWTVPHTSTAYLVDLSESPDVLKTSSGKVVSLDTFIREEDQESWRGSTGNLNGDVNVRGLTADPDEEVRCRRCHFYCNGVKTCELIDPTLFDGCERYEPDDEAMRALWNHELEANEREAGSASGIISRFYNRVKQSKCKIKCDGVPVLIGLRTPSVYAKSLFVGCSKWTRAEKYQHRYALIPANVNETTFRFVLENDGLLPSGGPTSLNEHCVLTVHPRVVLSNCPYSHIVDGRIRTPAMIPRPCPTEMIIMIPVADKSALLRKAIVVLRGAHNHPAHPHTKPSSDDRMKLETAVQAAGLTGLTVKKLLHASSTAIVYNGERLAESSPAFASRRKVRDFITEQKKKEHPFGLGWEGVQNELNTREAHLAKQDRYIHTAMSKNGFRLVVTMHPQIAMFIHLVLSLSIDYTFKRVKGRINEWEVASLLDRVNYRLTFASLYCDAQTKEGFAQLFTELFDTIFSVTGERLKISPFFPDAKCRVVLLDGEVPQALGFGMFLATYNDPAISGIWTRDPTKLLSYVLKTCNPHFHRLIDELPKSIPQSVIRHMKSIMGLDNQAAIDAWHVQVASEPYEEVKNWHAHKLANPFVLASVNKFLSKVDPDSWDITPNHSNYGESAHAGRNAETSIGVGLFTAILQAKERDNEMAKELAQIERDGVTRNRWNGTGEREKHAARRQVAKLRRSAVRNDQVTSYSTLQAEREAGVAENKASLERQRLFETEIRSLQDQLKIDKRRGDLREEVNVLRRDVEDEKSLRREWNTRRAQIDVELSDLRKGPLAGARIKGRRPAEGPSVDNESVSGLGEGDNGTEPDDEGTDLPAELEPSFTEHNVLQVEDAFSSAEPEPSFQDWDWISSVQPDANFTADMRAFEQNMIPNPTDVDFDLDEFFASCDPMTLDFAAPEGSNIPQNLSDDLEYMGDPAIDYSGPTLLQQGNIANSPPFQSLDLQHQELPPLPMPAMSPPEEQPEDEGDAVNVVAGTRPRLDIDLELDERNVIAGKRQRTQSTRARETAAAPPNKKKNVA